MLTTGAAHKGDAGRCCGGGDGGGGGGHLRRLTPRRQCPRGVGGRTAAGGGHFDGETVPKMMIMKRWW